MVATVTIRRWTGTSGSPVKTDITGINTRANAADAHSTNDTASPVTIVTGQTHYSYWVTTRLSADTTPTGTIDNIRWYTDGSNTLGTGVTMKAQDASSYVQATGSTGNGTQLTTGNHVGLSGAPVDAFTLTDGAPKAVTGSISNPSTGDFGDFIVYQVEVADTASAGTTGTETLTWKYDET